MSLTDGLRFARTRPAFAFALFVALCAPTLIAFLPLDRALAPLLDLRPHARDLIVGDDGAWMELGFLAPSLAGTALGSGIVALCLSVPAAWLVSAFTAARALGLSLPAGAIAQRGLAVSLLALPLRAVPIIASALVVIGARDTRTLAALLPWAICAGVIYFVGSAAITVTCDFTRGAALLHPQQPLLSALGAGLAVARQRWGLFVGLVLAELALASLALVAIGVTRPLGVFGIVTFALGTTALVLRAIGSTALVAVAATNAAFRSG